MNWESLVGVVVGAALTYTSQWATERRTIKRDAARATAEAAARQRTEWKAMQVQTILDLQEQMEAHAAGMGAIVGAAAERKRDQLTILQLHETLKPGGRIVLLLTRLEDRELADDVFGWLRDLRAAAERSASDEMSSELKDRRLALQGRLGTAVRSFHPA